MRASIKADESSPQREFRKDLEEESSIDEYKQMVSIESISILSKCPIHN
jgi:hypothetical protein